jgi:hypothetical protein
MQAADRSLKSLDKRIQSSTNEITRTGVISSILVGSSVQMNDRMHSYISCSAVKAKGFNDPISTYAPLRYIPYDSRSLIDSFCGLPTLPIKSEVTFGGRYAELEDSIDFLVRQCNDEQSQANGNKAKLLLVVADESCGVELYLTSASAVLSAFLQPNRYVCFRGRCFSSSGMVRFVLWKTLLADMLTFIGDSLTSASKLRIGNDSSRKLPTKYVALEFILSRLSPSVRELSPLLVHFGLIPKSYDMKIAHLSTSRMSNTMKLTKMIEFMAAAIESAVDYCNNTLSVSIAFVM